MNKLFFYICSLVTLRAYAAPTSVTGAKKAPMAIVRNVAVAASNPGLNKIAFVNDSDKPVYICRDRDDQGEVAPKASKCFGVEFFNDAQGKPSPRYFKISFSKKSCSNEPDVKYALAPNRNYRITTTAALKTDDLWTNGCPPLTPEQQAAEQASGGVVAKVMTKGVELGLDIKNGVVKGYDETSNFFTNTAPNAVKDAYGKTAHFFTHDVGNAFETAGNAIAHGAKDAGNAIAHGAENAANTVGNGFKDAGNAIASSKANPSNW